MLGKLQLTVATIFYIFNTISIPKSHNNAVQFLNIEYYLFLCNKKKPQAASLSSLCTFKAQSKCCNRSVTHSFLPFHCRYPSYAPWDFSHTHSLIYALGFYLFIVFSCENYKKRKKEKPWVLDFQLQFQTIRTLMSCQNLLPRLYKSLSKDMTHTGMLLSSIR